MKKKTETIYSPFKFSLVDLANGVSVHEGARLVFRDQFAAYEQWDKLKQVPGAQLSAFGCGPMQDQHVYLPTCTGIMHIQAPAGFLKQNGEPIDKRVCIVGDKLKAGPDDIKIQSEWIRQVDFRIEGDIAHGPLVSMQLTEGIGLDYHDLQRFAKQRVNDLSKIVSAIASNSDEHRMRADLNDEHVRDSLRDMYCTSGFSYKRQLWDDQMTDEQRSMSIGLEYFQPYFRSLDVNLGIDGVIRHAHSLEQEFRDLFPAYNQNVSDPRIAAAETVAKIMDTHAAQSIDNTERLVFLSLKNNAERDVEDFYAMNDNLVQTDENEFESPSYDLDDLDER